MRPANRTKLRALAREPLLHFLLIGGLLFAVAQWRSRATRTDDSVIVVDAHVKAELAKAFRVRTGRTPSPDELAEQVRLHVEEEVLYREGVARRLHEDDPRVRLRVAEKMALVVKSQIVVPEPAESELRAWFEAHRERWKQPELVDFVHVFVQGQDAAAMKRAAELLEKLRAGAEPTGLGDRFSGGRHYRGRKLADLAQSFGEDFVRGMERQPPGEWAERRSRFGLHLLRIEKRTPPRSPELSDVRLEVIEQWKSEQRDEVFAARVADLAKRWRVEERD